VVGDHPEELVEQDKREVHVLPAEVLHQLHCSSLAGSLRVFSALSDPEAVVLEVTNKNIRLYTDKFSFEKLFV